MYTSTQSSICIHKLQPFILLFLPLKSLANAYNKSNSLDHKLRILHNSIECIFLLIFTVYLKKITLLHYVKFQLTVAGKPYMLFHLRDVRAP